MPIEVLDPTHGEDAEPFRAADRVPALDRLTVAIVSNGKQGTVPFFDALASELTVTHGAAEVVRVTKPNYSAPAGDEIMDRAHRWQVLVAGVGD